MTNIIFIFALALVIQSSVSLQVVNPATRASSPTTISSFNKQMTPMSTVLPCPCRCYLGAGKRQKASMVCGRERFAASGCVLRPCFKKGMKGSTCCEEEMPVPTSPVCPCRCFPGVPGRRRARRQCAGLKGMCAISRCGRKRKRRYQCCETE